MKGTLLFTKGEIHYYTTRKEDVIAKKSQIIVEELMVIKEIYVKIFGEITTYNQKNKEIR